jgi:GntR family transcriptional regulator
VSPAPIKSAPASRRQSLVDEAERVLRDWLASGQHRRGDRLPPEHDLSGLLGISRGTLRTALQRLERTGEVVRRQGSGTYVGDIRELRTFSEGLERLAPYSRLARDRGIDLRGDAVEVERHPLEDDLAILFDVELGATATVCTRILLANGVPAALMSDVVHPNAPLPPEADLRRALMRGQMLLDVLLEAAMPIAFSRTRIRARTIGPDDVAGRAFGVTEPTGVLELDETMYLRDGGVAQRSSDLFGPNSIDLHLIRHLDTEQPGPVVRANGS